MAMPQDNRGLVDQVHASWKCLCSCSWIH